MNSLVVFPTFFSSTLNFAIRSSWSEPQSAPGLVFADCIELLHLWLQRIKLIWFSVLTIWWCPRVESSLVLLKEGICYNSVFSWQNSVSLCPASFCSPRPNLPVIPGISWLFTFAFQFPMMKSISFPLSSMQFSREIYLNANSSYVQGLDPSSYFCGLLFCLVIFR